MVSPVAIDVKLSKLDWTSLRAKKLFWVPAIVEAYVSVNTPMTQAELLQQSPATGNQKYSSAIVRDVVSTVPIKAEKAFAVTKGFNQLDGRSTKTIVSALFLLNQHADLFSARALEKQGFSIFSLGIGLQKPTVRNVIKGGRITAYVAKTFLEGVQAAYADVYAGRAEVPPVVASFIESTNLRSYVTSSPKAGYTEVLKDGAGEYLCADDDLLPAPEGWRTWT